MVLELKQACEKHYAQQRAHSGLCDLQVLDDDWRVVETITNEDLKPVV